MADTIDKANAQYEVWLSTQTHRPPPPPNVWIVVARLAKSENKPYPMRCGVSLASRILKRANDDF